MGKLIENKDLFSDDLFEPLLKRLKDIKKRCEFIESVNNGTVKQQLWIDTVNAVISRGDENSITLANNVVDAFEKRFETKK